MPATRPLADRFWSKVDKNGPVPTGHPEYEGLGPCWVYNGGKNPLLALPLSHKIGPHEPKRVLAWRYSWEAQNGPIPSGLVVRHRCDNGTSGVCCVNPAHLVLGTQKDNVEDMYRRRIVAPREVSSEMAAAIIELRNEYGVPNELLQRAVGLDKNALDDVLYAGRTGVEPAKRRKAATVTDEEVERVVALLAEGKSLLAAAGEVGRSWGAVRAALGARGIEYRRPPLLTAEELATVRAVLAEGKSVGAAAHAVGRSWNRVRQAVHEAGLDAEIPTAPEREVRTTAEQRSANSRAAQTVRWARARAPLAGS